MAAAQEKSGHRISFEPSPRRVRVEFNGSFIADSTRAHLMHETGHVPVYYFPRDDVRMDLLEPTDHGTHCPYKGDASYFSVVVDGRRAENAVWRYPEPIDAVREIADYVAFYWNEMDHWYEEDEEVFVHARDPYCRVDVVQSRRQVQVVLGGETVADTRDALFLFETGLPTRYYFPGGDVRMDLLSPTDTTTPCPYKGEAVYWSAEIGGKAYGDIAWSYPDPITELPRIKGLIAFYNENVDAIRIDGEDQPKPRTKWSVG